ncbi:unnamed protein product [Medioppia subpectinata]|uniref:AB hydrolase-1 domain-containing protein n=1 Tax=Medioppia subpectinata TaxID=1979941 RepID=A0A7R9Q4A6_9ACAR|nr:unnamed protein product [Medioppia subpectinata]CAG2111270.1 unnamed protein product [Medioppia subpectinata]
MGTGRSDFSRQLEGEDAFDLKRYTFVAVELPGWGRSRPPARPYGLDVYHNDAECCFKVMDDLGFKTYSVIGWSDGAKVALLMAYMNPNRITCSVAIGIFVWATKQTIAPMMLTRDTKRWPKEQFDTYCQVYGDEETLQRLWDQHINFCRAAMENCGDGQYLVTPEQLRQIRNPVLLVHGDMDPLISIEHPMYCKNNIPDAVLHRFPGGSHNCHQVFAKEFKKLIENFFADCESGGY